MADTPKRARRADRYAETPERVSAAAQQMQASASGAPVPPVTRNERTAAGTAQIPQGNARPSGQGVYPPQNYQGQMPGQMPPQVPPQQGIPPQNAQGQMPARQMIPPQGQQMPPQYMPAAGQPGQQMPPQYAGGQDPRAAYYADQKRKRQQEEKERVSSQTASHGAFRGYTANNLPPIRDTRPPEEPKKSRKSGKAALILLICAVLAAAGVYLAVDYLPKQRHIREVHETVTAYDNLFVDGVYVDGIHLGGMTPEQGLNSVQSQIQRRNDAWSVTLTWQGTQLAQINAGMLGMSVDIGQVLNDAWAQGHTGSEEARYEAMNALRETPYEAYTATPSGDTSVIDNVLAQVKNQIDTPAVNARLLSFDPSQPYPFTFQQDSKGRRLNTEEVREELYRMVATMTSGTVELEPEVIDPEETLIELQRHYMLRSSVYTPISTSSEEDRNNNIRRALEFVNGYVLQPGSQFSFNNVVGQRTEANGFYPAIEYAYGEHVMGIGGGVCQASTTVYQAAVCAGLQILKREPHSDAVSYTEYGKDATVYWVGKRNIDLVFRNTTDDPIYIVAAVQQDPSNKRRLIAKVSMYGADMGDVRYEIECKTVEEIDPPETPTYIKDKNAEYVTYTDQQKSVSKAQPGYVVESYRVKYVGGREEERALLYVDTYEPKAERIYVGVTKRGE